MNGETIVLLPGGCWLDGVRHSEARLHPLDGRDEAFLVEDAAGLLPAEQVTALLTRCLSRLGPHDQVTAEQVRGLTVGDREALLLHLRRLTLGDAMQCVLSCPNPACGQKMDLELRASHLLLPPYPGAQPHYETTITENGSAYDVRFRLPTGSDQEAAALRASVDPQTAAELILRRCVDSVTSKDEEEPFDDWPAVVSEQIPERMAELDPQAEIILNLTCPACGHTFSTTFDTATFFLQEMAGRVNHLFQEVHHLAYHYHWSESEIMGMTARKRGRYLELLAEALAEEQRR